MDLGVLVGYVMKLKNFLNHAYLEDNDTRQIFQDIFVTLLAVAADSDLGTHPSLDELNVAVMPRRKKCDTTTSSANVKSCDLLLGTLPCIKIQSLSKNSIVNVTEKGLQEAMAMGWYHHMEYDLEMLTSRITLS